MEGFPTIKYQGSADLDILRHFSSLAVLDDSCGALRIHDEEGSCVRRNDT